MYLMNQLALETYAMIQLTNALVKFLNEVDITLKGMLLNLEE